MILAVRKELFVIVVSLLVSLFPYYVLIAKSCVRRIFRQANPK